MSIWNWFGLDVEPGAEWAIRWTNAPAPWFTALVVIPGLLLFVALLYRRHQTPGTRARRGLLAATRFLILLIVILMLFDPILAVEKQVTRRSYVAVLVDDSSSMAFEDHHPHAEAAKLARAAGWITGDGPMSPAVEDRVGQANRWALLQAVWDHNQARFLERLTETHTVKLYSFSTRLRRDPVMGAGAPAPEGAHTKMGDAIRDVLDDLKGQLVAGIVVLTDGRSNAGNHSPVEAARSAAAHGRGVPVFTVGVGADRVPSDLRLVQVKAPDVVLTDEQVKIEFTVSQTGFDGARVRAELHKETKDGPVIADVPIRLLERPSGDTAPSAPQKAILKVKPFEQEGEYELVLHIPPDPEDRVPENNTRRLRIRVVDGKLKVLYVDGRPRFEYRHFSLALTRDDRVAANVLLADSDVGVKQRTSRGVRPLAEFPMHATSKDTPDGSPGLFDFDVLIIGDVAFDSRETGFGIFRDPKRQMELVERFVDEVGGGVIFLAGPDAMPWRYRGGAGDPTPIEKLLPVELLTPDEMAHPSYGALTEGDAGLQPQLTPNADRHVLLQLHPDTSSDAPNKLLLQGLEGFFWTAPVRGPKLHAEVLLQHALANPTTGIKRPILATMWYGRGRTVFVGTDEIWRWRLLQGDRYYYRFFSNCIRFAGNNRLLGDERRFEISLEKTTFTLGERVVVRARVWDEGYRPLAEPEVTVQHDGGDGRPVPLLLEGVEDGKGGTRPGEFEGSFVANRLGPHRLWFDIEHGNQKTKASLVSFDVIVPQREMDNPSRDDDILQSVWEESGATAAATEAAAPRDKFFHLWELPVVASSIPDRKRILSGVDATYRLWDTWLVFLLLTGLLCVEWIVRKLTRLP